MKLKKLLILAILSAYNPALAAECTINTLSPPEKQKLEQILNAFSSAAFAETKKVCASGKPPVETVYEKMPYVEIWIDKDGKTLRRDNSQKADLTLVVVSDGVIGLERDFNSDTSYNIGEGLPGIIRSYYIKSHIDGKYRVISNVLYVKG